MGDFPMGCDFGGRICYMRGYLMGNSSHGEQKGNQCQRWLLGCICNGIFSATMGMDLPSFCVVCIYFF
jgi:hypothetical protein